MESVINTVKPASVNDDTWSQLSSPDDDIKKWVESNCILDIRQSAEPGPKKISRTPALMPLYEWFMDDHIREIVIQKPAQIAVTSFVVDCISWISKNDPSPTALFLADAETARKIMKFRIVPAFRNLGFLNVTIAANKQQDFNKYEITLSNGFYLAVSWGSSISQTASMAFKRVFADEINKPGYDVIKDESDALGRISERMETFGDSKFVKLSTPTLDSGRITQEMKNCDVIYDYRAPCPKCGVPQAMSFSQVVWEGGKKANSQQLIDTVRYKCADCGYLWTEAERIVAVSNGIAIQRTQSERHEVIGYQLHRLVSLFKGGDMARMAKSFIRAQDDQLKLQNIVNSSFGEPWIPRLSADADTMKGSISKCRNGLARLVLPEDCLAIVATIDVQNEGFWYLIRAICSDTARHMIDCGFVATWDELDAVIFEKTYGKKQVWRCLIDTGGGKNKSDFISRTEETYGWIRSNNGRNGVQTYGTKGSSRELPTKLRIGSPIEKMPSGKPIPGGIRIISVNTDVGKNAVWFRIDKTCKSPESPGNWWVHREVPDWYCEQMTAEVKELDRKTKKPIWRRIRHDNHMFDLEVLQEIAIDPEFYGGIRPLLVRRSRKAVIEPIEKEQPDYHEKYEQNPVLRRF